jgi:hypothetical protein
MAILTKTTRKQGHDAINGIIKGYFVGAASSMAWGREVTGYDGQYPGGSHFACNQVPISDWAELR